MLLNPADGEPGARSDKRAQWMCSKRGFRTGTPVFVVGRCGPRVLRWVSVLRSMLKCSCRTEKEMRDHLAQRFPALVIHQNHLGYCFNQRFCFNWSVGKVGRQASIHYLKTSQIHSNVGPEQRTTNLVLFPDHLWSPIYGYRQVPKRGRKMEWAA